MGKVMRSQKWLARSKARFAALQALYQIEQTAAESVANVIAEFRGYRFTTDNYNPVDSEFFEKLVTVWGQCQADIDAYISKNLSQDWRLERLESSLRALLRLAVVENDYLETPKATIRGEYIELARAFIDEKDMAFVTHFLMTLIAENFGSELEEDVKETFEEDDKEPSEELG